MSRIASILITVILLFSATNVSAGNYDSGEKLFKANCASCHNMEKKMSGPALLGILDRVPSEEWLYKWIKNNNELRASGDAYANKVFKENGGGVMSVFAWMSQEELGDVVTYITTYAPKAATDSKDSGLIPCEEPVQEKDNSGLYLMLGVITLALLIIAIFSGINRSLKNAKTVQDGGEAQEGKTFYEAIATFAQNRKKLFGIIMILVLLTVSKLGWDYLMVIGVSGGNGFEKTEDVKNYRPAQPIHFKHNIHVKQNKIDCKYCHSGVLDSKHALIPSANVCMNCHAAVNEGHCEGSKDEIQKIYDATGWVPEKGQYLHADGKYYDKPREDKPIKWVKVHNLQDFVYFNHSQHVVVGGLDCKECHGDVENMTIAEQYAPLTMGWCVDCHKKTEINEKMSYTDKPNGYYEKLHDEYKEAWKHQKDFDFTVEKIGGLECGKCHY